MTNKSCEDYPLIQNWNYIFADNAEEYLNDIIGHIFCESPRFRGSLDATTSQVSAGSSFDLTVTMSYDSVVPPPGKEISRFKLLRPRAYINYPEQWLTVTGIDKEDEAEDLPGHDDDSEGGGVVYWARKNDDGDQEMLPGESEQLVIHFQVSDSVPADTTLPISVIMRSQRTLPYQNVDADLELTATGGPAPVCGDGACSNGEDRQSCPQDCPTRVGEDGVTSFGDPPCCDGLTMIRAGHPYSWAYDQCYDWEGGGVPFVQAYCTNCGDGECKGKENTCNCPQDCGPHCGNWICEPGENRSSCPSDC